MDKYNIDFPDKTLEADRIRLINQLWKLMPMRENNEDWQSHLYILIEEITGLVKIFKDNVHGLVLLSKLEGLEAKECNDFFVYRKTVFKCIDLLSRMMNDEQS